MRNLPIGTQSFVKLREGNAIYVDKTKWIHQITTEGTYYFFSRPRRFGKSLLISTLKELYKGNKSVFEGLWIENNWDWSKTNPVIHISFDALSYNQMGLENAISEKLDGIANDYNIELLKGNFKSRFYELIQKLFSKYGKVVILIDEYDKPILDFLETNNLSKAEGNRDILREFYGVLKDTDPYLQLVFITGISKFSKVSIFSHLNNLRDITLHPKYSTLVGYTQQEIELYFDDYLQAIQVTQNLSREELVQEMKVWYNGFSWDGINKVYNPFGTLNFLDQQIFRNFWFSTGSPRFLVDKMRTEVLYNVENTVVDSITLDKFDLDNIELVPLLFQTGYLTVKSLDIRTGEMVLDYPNKEVRESMYQFLISDLARNPHRTNTGRTMRDLNKAFLEKDLETVKTIINSILADLPSETYLKQSEGLYHGLIHLIFSYLGMLISSDEVHSSQGRADAVVETPSDVFIFEFKFNKTAREAIEQIKTKKYASKYQNSGKNIVGIGVNFDNESKQIDDWLEENLGQ
jgi:Predicted AAA-ATPase/PD-(D/E)XK nuclease superfamily